MKKVSLKELNKNGQLVSQFKSYAYKRGDKLSYYNDDPNSCYLHYYNNKYYVTYHILNTEQNEYDNLSQAIDKFEKIFSHSIF